MSNTEAEIRSRLAVLSPLHLHLQNDSHLHIGHAGNTGGGHFSLVIVSATFEGQSRINRQRLVKNALADLFPTRIHALSIKALTPREHLQS
ncbi:BolA protein [Neisseria sp. HSC-16F19]|nr:BolA family protein [Neisseria sp. HSC-16F19]MCP2039720.1 BolA protein [Neisseria sp. HSC-16F19]